MPQPYGKNLIAALEALDTLGPSTVAQLKNSLPPEAHAKAHLACHWAVNYQLMTEHGTERPRIYSVAPGWRDKVAARQRAAPDRSASEPYSANPDSAPEFKTPAAIVAVALANRHPLEEAWAGFR